MTIELIGVLAALYAAIGLVLSFKGKLATRIMYDVALTTTHNGLSGWKVAAYRCTLRLGVIVAWPVFLINN